VAENKQPQHQKEFDFDNPLIRWNREAKIEGGEPDDYILLDSTRVYQLLGPLEWMVKRTCYASKFSKVANLLAARFVAEKRPVRLRFLVMGLGPSESAQHQLDCLLQ
jgi:hypothetical protein